MEQTTNIPPAAATDEPAVPPTFMASDRPAARVSSRLTESLIEPALDAGRDVRPDRATRIDGWTPDRIRIFLDALAECGVVEDAARAAGMTKQSAYNLRNRTAGRAFHVAWTAAEHLARRRVAGELMSRALHGCVEVIVRDGQVWGERHRFDNRLTMAVLARLDDNFLLRDDENRVARLVSEEFDQFVDLVCAGGEDAPGFIADRIAADSWTAAPEARILERCGNYARYGVGLPEEVEAVEREARRRKRRPAPPKPQARPKGRRGPPPADPPPAGEADEKPQGEIGFVPGWEPVVPELEDEARAEADGQGPEVAPEPEDHDQPDREDEHDGDEAEADVPIGAVAAERAGEAAAPSTAPEPPASAPPQGDGADPDPLPLASEPAAEPAFVHYSGWVASD